MRSKKFVPGSINNKLILDLGLHPFADTFISKNKLKKKEPIISLKVYLCKKTGIIQVGNITKAEERYNLYDYSYTSANSEYSRNHWKNFYKDIIKFLKKKQINVYEIGSNDGFLLSNFKKFGHKVMGIDASKFMTSLANKNKIFTLQKIFNFKNSKEILKKYGRCDLIIANNVLNHSNDPMDFIKGVHNILSDKGTFVFELPYWLKTVNTQKFDQIYHEHITYFTVLMAFNVLKKNNFQIKKITQNNYHGGSIRVFSQKSLQPKLNDKISRYIKLEKEKGLFKIKTYKKIFKFIKKKKKEVVDQIKYYKSKKYVIVGIGAAAKANTLINTFNLNYNHINFITESSKYKIGKFTPKSRIPIYNDEKLAKYKKICAILFTWNLKTQLKKKLLSINKSINFIEVF
ncbi:MAG: methyltransferase domain-containing protein [Pelagibacterales bacterium]|nr:methyltransferase domain-containing protein [Pelagibacterales bacterium]